MLSKDSRISKPREFYKIKKLGTTIKSDNFSIKYIKNQDSTKISFIVSKLVTPVSPKRNKLKRIFRALFRELNPDLKSYLVVYPKISSLKIKYNLLKEELTAVLDKIKG